MAAANPPKPFSVAIVGGGITGLTLAISLLQHNVPITVYESAAKFGEIGAGVGFGPNAVRAMKLISPEILKRYGSCRTKQWQGREKVWFASRVGDQRKAGEDGTFEFEGQPGFKVGDALYETPYTDIDELVDEVGGVGGVHRAHFLDHLVEMLPESIARFGKRLIDITKAEDSGDAVLHFADGTTAQHTVVFGCDGIKAQSRKILLGSNDYDAVFSGKCCYRGLVPMTKAVEHLGAENANNSQIYFGYHGHILTFPIAGGKIMNVVAFASRKSWDSNEWIATATREDMMADYETWGPPATTIVSVMEKTDIWALFDHPAAPTYYGTQPRICLVGDAAHASTPHQGAGAGMGIEDAYILGNLIGESKSVEELDKALRAYDEVRRPRTQKLVTTSREAGTLWDFELEGDDIDAVRRNQDSRMHWIWTIDLKAELERARAIFRRV
ncbi:mannitol 1-phosphate dehydrogenase 2 [Xylariaceae sp. FL1272]|nr:mannitol 1-phosphate dehydrogenase 2 [Xylariaceae sp. FL1272]